MEEQRARTEIEQAFPELPVRAIVFLGAGMDSDAYLVNGEWVFRFPKRQGVARALSREIAMLPKLAPRLPVAIPRFEFVGQQIGSGLLFVGYRLIQGKPLTIELFDSLTRPDQERILATLAAFLRGVHSFPLDEAVAVGVEAHSTREWVEDCLANALPYIGPLLSPLDHAALARKLERFLADARNFAYAPRLLYADFAPEHILYDARADGIGIIDWGDLEIGDSDYDLLYLRQDYGEDFVRRFLDHYPHPEPARLLEKLRVFDACDYMNRIVDALGSTAERAAIDESVAALDTLQRE